MNRQISNWEIITIALVASLVLVFMSIKMGYDTGFTAGQAPYKSSTNTTISLDKALAILAEGRQNHLDWATRPDLIACQDKNTGDTVFNLMWAGYYTDLEELVKRLAEEKLN